MPPLNSYLRKRISVALASRRHRGWLHPVHVHDTAPRLAGGGRSGQRRCVQRELRPGWPAFPGGGRRTVDGPHRTHQPATGITQAISTSPGAHYTLSFEFGNIVNPGGIFGTTSSVEASVNGQVVRTVTNVLGAGQGVLIWQHVSVNFTADSASTTISFLNRDPKTDNSNGIDAVTVARD